MDTTTMPRQGSSPLRAKYNSPCNTETLTRRISAPLPSRDGPALIKDKVAYLAELRVSTKQLQEDINVFLTQKMDDDKASAAVPGQNVVGGGTGGGEQRRAEMSKEEMGESYGAEEFGDDEV
jgi:Gon7 family